MQLEGEVQLEDMADRYRLTLPFRIARTHVPQGGDPRQVVLTSAARDGAQH